MSQARKAEKTKSKGMWPIFGLLMAVAAGAIAWVLAPEALNFVYSRSPSFGIGSLTTDQVELLFGAVIFFIIISIGGMIVAMFMPKKQDEVKDSSLRKEKEQMTKDDKARKVRKVLIERELKKNNKKLE